ESFEALHQKRKKSLPFRAGWVASIVLHSLLMIAAVVVKMAPGIFETEAISGGGGFAPPAAGRIVDFKLPPLPPLSVSQSGAREAFPPDRPTILSEASSSARGEANPNPTGQSQLPKATGVSPELPRSLSGKSDAFELKSAGNSTGQPGAVGGISAAVPRGRNSERPDDAITTDTPRASGGNRTPDLAEALRSARRDPSQDLPALANPQSSVTAQGEMSLNALGVGAFEQYRRYVVQAIQQRWAIPVEANLLQSTVRTVVVFEVARNGQLLDARVKQPSGYPVLDRAALRAVQVAAPFRPLPSVFLYPSQVFTDTFTYYPPGAARE
ncbi:MAG: TonB family protein, partial [Acidobacteria bacterium]|nr:TonB family protein [Acidobacteriota bacterium]